MGWSVSKVKQYSALKGVDADAWDVVVTTFESCSGLHMESTVTEKVTNVTFNEGLLRQIVNLTPAQQLELVTDFSTGDINKNKFKVLAEKYQQQNNKKALMISHQGFPPTKTLLHL